MIEPNIFKAFERITMDEIGGGRKSYSSKAVFETIRANYKEKSKDRNFKINNNYTPLYSRAFEDKHPQYRGFFRMRKSKYDKK